MKIFIVFVTFVTLVIHTETSILEDGTRLLTIWTDTSEHFKFLNSFNPVFDFLKITRLASDVLVPKESFNSFATNLKKKQIGYEIAAEDVKKVLDEVKKEESKRRKKRSVDFFDSFLRYDEILDHLQDLAEHFNETMKLKSIGDSFEGRQIPVVEISSGKGRRALLIDAGIHAREWIAPSSALYAIQELVTNPENRYLFENVDIYIIPLLNPDGYEFSHLNTSTRYWRKTRSTHSDCDGVDANRNFDFGWTENNCSDIYPGTKAFSEPETAALRDYFFLKSNIDVYLTLHTYGGSMMYPWSHSNITSPFPYTHACVASKTTEKMSKVNNNNYTYGGIASTLYNVYGGSIDWAFVMGNAYLTYVIEIPGIGRTGFAPTSESIEPLGREIFEGIKVLIDYMEGNICN